MPCCDTNCPVGMANVIWSKASLRPLWISEVSLLWEGLRALAEFESKSSEFTCTESWLTEQIFGPDPKLMAYLFWEQDQLLGFVTMYTSFGTFAMRKKCFVEDLFIWPQYRNRGLGQQLMLAAKDVARNRGYHALEWKVLKWNTKAHYFYETLGARKDQEWENYFWQ